jgi:hypothetical protein
MPKHCTDGSWPDYDRYISYSIAIDVSNSKWTSVLRNSLHQRNSITFTKIFLWIAEDTLTDTIHKSPLKFRNFTGHKISMIITDHQVFSGLFNRNGILVQQYFNDLKVYKHWGDSIWHHYSIHKKFKDKHENSYLSQHLHFKENHRPLIRCGNFWFFYSMHFRCFVK